MSIYKSPAGGSSTRPTVTTRSATSGSRTGHRRAADEPRRPRGSDDRREGIRRDAGRRRRSLAHRRLKGQRRADHETRGAAGAKTRSCDVGRRSGRGRSAACRARSRRDINTRGSDTRRPWTRPSLPWGRGTLTPSSATHRWSTRPCSCSWGTITRFLDAVREGAPATDRTDRRLAARRRQGVRGQGGESRRRRAMETWQKPDFKVGGSGRPFRRQPERDRRRIGPGRRCARSAASVALSRPESGDSRQLGADARRDEGRRGLSGASGPHSVS